MEKKKRSRRAKAHQEVGGTWIHLVIVITLGAMMATTLFMYLRYVNVSIFIATVQIQCMS